MKICRWVGIPILLLCVASGCSSVAPKELVAKKSSESFCLVLVRPHDRNLAPLPIQIDGYHGRLRSGSFIELELSPGIHSISARHGAFFSHDFPPASTNVSGREGERRFFSCVLQYGSVDIFIPINGIPGDFPMTKPIQAEWKEISQQEFEAQFPHAKFNY